MEASPATGLLLLLLLLAAMAFLSQPVLTATAKHFRVFDMYVFECNWHVN
jgi:hypothetical protein